MTRQKGTLLEIRTWDEWVGPQVVARSHLNHIWQDLESVDPRFPSSSHMGLLPAHLTGLYKNSFGLGRYAAVFCRHIHLPHATFSQSLHSMFLGSSRPRAQDDFCAKNIHSSTRHVSPCASQHTEHQHKFSLSHPPLLCCCRPLLRTQTCCPRIHLSAVKIQGRMVLLRNSTPPQVMSPKGSSSTGFWSTHRIKK